MLLILTSNSKSNVATSRDFQFLSTVCTVAALLGFYKNTEVEITAMQ